MTQRFFYTPRERARAMRLSGDSAGRWLRIEENPGVQLGHTWNVARKAALDLIGPDLIGPDWIGPDPLEAPHTSRNPQDKLGG